MLTLEPNRFGLAMKNTKSDVSRFNSFTAHSYGDTPLFSGASYRADCTKHKELNRTRKGPYAPK